MTLALMFHGADGCHWQSSGGFLVLDLGQGMTAARLPGRRPEFHWPRDFLSCSLGCDLAGHSGCSMVWMRGQAVTISPVPQPLQQAALVGISTADESRADVGRDVGIRSLAAPLPDRGVLDGAPGRTKSHQVVPWVGRDVHLQAGAQVVNLPAVLLGHIRRHVDLALGMPGQRGVIDMAVCHQPFRGSLSHGRRGHP
jgi:hypothetical protein